MSPNEHVDYCATSNRNTIAYVFDFTQFTGLQCMCKGSTVGYPGCVNKTDFVDADMANASDLVMRDRTNEELGSNLEDATSVFGDDWGLPCG